MCVLSSQSKLLNSSNFCRTTRHRLSINTDVALREYPAGNSMFGRPAFLYPSIPPVFPISPYSNPTIVHLSPSAVLPAPSFHSRRSILVSLLVLPALSFPSYDTYAPSYDILDGFNPLTNFLGFKNLRRRLISQATGHVLETGVGTGLNLPLYNYSLISSLTALDLSGGMLALARERASTFTEASQLLFLQATVDNTQLPSASFDTIVDTFNLCVYSNPVEALEEMKRLVRTDGRVLLLEHTKSTNALLAAYQDLTASATAAMSKGCYPNQDVLKLVRSIGFKVLNCEYHVAGSIIYLELGV